MCLFVDSSGILQIKHEEIIILSHNWLFWTHLFLCEPSGVSGNVVPPTLRPLPVIQPQLPTVLWLARCDSLVDSLILTADQQKLLPPFVGVQTEEETQKKKSEELTWIETCIWKEEAPLINIFILFVLLRPKCNEGQFPVWFRCWLATCSADDSFYHRFIVYDL